MNRFAILLDGDMTPTGRLKRQLQGCRVIAADGGIRHAAALNLVPEVWLGDFDSAPDQLPANLNDVPRIAYPEDKDATDGEIAVNEALARGAGELMMVGAFGGARADHALLQKTMAVSLAKRGVTVTLCDGGQEGYPILPGTYRFELSEGTLFSLVGLSELSGLSVTGVKWPLDRVKVPIGSSLTLSNVVVDGLTIELERGSALMIAQVAG